MLNSLSLFLPCFNEERNISRVINSALKVLPKIASQYEILIINDGSSDKTQKVVENKLDDKVRLINHQKNMGYGMALRTGIGEARYEWTFWTDGDGQFDIGQLKDFLPFVDRYEAIIGYRHNRAEGFRRAINTKLYNFAVNLVFGLKIRDYDCAFKLIRTRRLKKLSLQSTGAFTSAEILYNLSREKISLKELPVRHLPRLYGSPTGNSIEVIATAFREAIAIRLKHRR